MFDLASLVRDNIANMKPYSSARNEYAGDLGIFLDANENPFGELNRYPDPNQKKLKARLSVCKGVFPDQIFVGNGSDEIIDLLYRIVCRPGIDQALTFVPSYGMYKVLAAINDVELIQVPLTPDFQIDLKKSIEQIELGKVKLIFICTPNNPTGNAISREAIECILRRFKGIVAVDEAYIDFSGTESMIDLLNRYPNLVVIQTMSKAHALANARVGFAYAHEDLVMVLNKVKPPYNVSGLNQTAALNALLDEGSFKRNVDLLIEERKKMEKNLVQLKSVIKVYPSDANFLLVVFRQAKETFDRLTQLKIIVRNRTEMVNNCIRITVGSPAENEQLIQVLKRIEK